MKYLLSFLFLYLSSFSAQAQNVTFHGSKHYNIKVNQFNKEGSLPANAIIMLGDSHSEYGENWNRFFPNAKKIINRGIIGDDRNYSQAGTTDQTLRAKSITVE